MVIWCNIETKSRIFTQAIGTATQMMKIGVLFLLFVSFLFEVYSQHDEWCPPPSENPGPCEAYCKHGYRCGPDFIGRCCLTACGGTSCLSTLPWWCPPESPKKHCSVDPCTVQTCPEIPWAECYNDDPCEPCEAHFYVDGLTGLDRVPESMCNGTYDV